MTETPSSVRNVCNSCNQTTDHSIKGTYTHPPGTPAIDPYPDYESQILRESVASYFERKLGWPVPEDGWQWITQPDEWSPDDEVDDVIEGLDDWLSTPGSHHQELYPEEEMTTSKLLNQGWPWYDILL